MTSSEPAGIPERIAEEATRLFVTNGYVGVSMREIAQAVGISKAGLYYHFRDKEDLFIAILTANLERIEAIILAAQQAEPTARGQIGRMMQAIFDQPPDQRAVVRLASQEIGHVSQAARAEFGRLYRAKFTGRVEDILRAGIQRGELRAMDPGTATWILLGMAYPFLYPAREPGEAGDAARLLVDIFFDGAAGG
jgi:TetR/AcrR family transcriptional regulator, cholesterol catabolism regulator